MIVHPDLREGVMTSCDIPTDIRPVLDNFSSIFPNLDLHKQEAIMKQTNGKDHLWFLENLESDRTDELRELIIKHEQEFSHEEAMLEFVRLTGWQEPGDSKLKRI